MDKYSNASIVLEILDTLERFRFEKTDCYDDYTVRVCEAAIAKAFGIASRDKWTEILKNDSRTFYHEKYNSTEAWKLGVVTLSAKKNI